MSALSPDRLDWAELGHGFSRAVGWAGWSIGERSVAWQAGSGEASARALLHGGPYWPGGVGLRKFIKSQKLEYCYRIFALGTNLIKSCFFFHEHC